MLRRILLAIAKRVSALVALFLTAEQHAMLRRTIRVSLGLQNNGPKRRPGEPPTSADAAALSRPSRAKPEYQVEKNDLGCLQSEFVGLRGEMYEDLPTLPHAMAWKSELVLCCAFTGRHRVLHQAIQESLQVDGVFWLLVGSTEEDWLFIRAMSATTGRVAGFTTANRPLGRKWQTCVRAAGGLYNAPLYGITGSDDVIPAVLLREIIRRQRHAENSVDPRFRPSVYATLEWLVVVTDPKSRWVSSVFRCNYAGDSAFQTLGAGRFYTREFLESQQFLIFDSDKEKLLDDRGHFAVKACDGLTEYHGIYDGPVVSVKGEWSQLNAIDSFMAAQQLEVREFSFEGRVLLQRVMGGSAFQYLFRPSRLGLQSTFGASKSDSAFEPASSPADSVLNS